MTAKLEFIFQEGINHHVSDLEFFLSPAPIGMGSEALEGRRCEGEKGQGSFTDLLTRLYNVCISKLIGEDLDMGLPLQSRASNFKLLILDW